MEKKERWVELFKEVIGRVPTAKEFQAGRQTGFDFKEIKRIAAMSEDANSGLQTASKESQGEGKQQLAGETLAFEDRTSQMTGVLQEGSFELGVSAGQLGQGQVGRTRNEERAVSASEEKKKAPVFWMILTGILAAMVIGGGVYLYAQSQKKEDSSEASITVKHANQVEKKSSTSQSSTSKKEEAKASSSAATSKEASSQPAQVAPVATGKWNASKTNRLNDYVFSYWGPAMGQNYKAYSPGNNIRNYLPLPDDALNGSWNVTLDGQTIQLEWSTNGTASPGKYALVAVLSDAENAPYLKQHIYFFVIKDGQPRVIITEQTQDTPGHRLYFKDTENTELRNFYYNLVNE